MSNAGKVDVSLLTAGGKEDILTYGFTYEGAVTFRVPLDYPTIQAALLVLRTILHQTLHMRILMLFMESPTTFLFTWMMQI